jgi:hypothetical protein
MQPENSTSAWLGFAGQVKLQPTLLIPAGKLGCRPAGLALVEFGRCEFLHRSPGGSAEPGAARDLQYRPGRPVHRTTSPACWAPLGLPSVWTAAAALPITSSSNGSGAVSSTRRSTSKPTRTWPRRGKVSPPTSSYTIANDCTRRWLTAPCGRSSTKRRQLPVRRGGKMPARAQHYQHNEMKTWAGFPTLRSPDRCLEDRVHLSSRCVRRRHRRLAAGYT